MTMTSSHKKGVAIAILIIAVGVAWLLNVAGVLPGVDWIWTVSIGGVGALVLALGRLNQVSFIVGTFLIVASVLSVLRQTGKMSVEVEVPVLVIAFGALMLVSFLLRLPVPDYLKLENDPQDHDGPSGAR